MQKKHARVDVYDDDDGDDGDDDDDDDEDDDDDDDDDDDGDGDHTARLLFRISGIAFNHPKTKQSPEN